MLRTRRSLVPLLAMSIVVAGCPGDSPVEPDPSGSVSFNSTGAVSGSFTAQGELRMTAANEPEWGNWAAADRAPDGSLTVLGFRAGTAPRGDLFILELASATAPGTIQLCADEDCPGFAALITGLDTVSDELFFQRLCFIISGSANLQTITTDRARGTFSGQGVCLDAELEDPQQIAITNGSFDVPRVQNLGGL